jgi:uncharacterized membrane protein
VPAANAFRRITPAVLLGLAVGLRTFSAPAALALGKRPLNAPRLAVLIAAVGELIADKLPAMPSRLGRRGLTGRLLSGAITGRLVAGSPGAASGAGAALASAFVGHRARSALPSPLAAVAEDCLAVSLAALGASRAAR